MSESDFWRQVSKIHSLLPSPRSYSVSSNSQRLYSAQDLIINNLLYLEKKLKKVDKKSDKYYEISRKISILKEYGDSIGWFILGANTSNFRAYYGPGSNRGYLINKNITSSLKIINEYRKNKKAFILLTDITNSVNIGDLIIKKDMFPPITLEMKEGTKNKELSELLENKSDEEEYLAGLEGKTLKRTKAHLQRLKSQNVRLKRINEYIVDDSKRYDEQLDTEVNIVKSQLKDKNYQAKLQKVYDDPSVKLKTIKIKGGLYVLFSRKSMKKGYNDDVLYFKHKMYHLNNHDDSKKCVIELNTNDRDLIDREISGLQKIEITSGVVVGGNGYIPTTTCLKGFSDKFAMELLKENISLHFYLDVEQFLDYLQSRKLEYWLVKRKSESKASKGLIVYKNKNIMLSDYTILTKAPLHRMTINFSTPEYEADVISELTTYLHKLTDLEKRKIATNKNL